VRDGEDVGIAAALDSDGHPGLVTSSPVPLEEFAGNLGGSTRITIDGADLKDSQCGLETTRGGSDDPSRWCEHHRGAELGTCCCDPDRESIHFHQSASRLPLSCGERALFTVHPLPSRAGDGPVSSYSRV
jgi:hypothetical protein